MPRRISLGKPFSNLYWIKGSMWINQNLNETFCLFKHLSNLNPYFKLFTLNFTRINKWQNDELSESSRELSEWKALVESKSMLHKNSPYQAVKQSGWSLFFFLSVFRIVLSEILISHWRKLYRIRQRNLMKQLSFYESSSEVKKKCWQLVKLSSNKWSKLIHLKHKKTWMMVFDVFT